MRGRRDRQCDDHRGAPLSRFDVLIIGTGHAGVSAALHLRQAGFTGSIGLLGEETELPYERPPLSKEYLTGTRGREDFRFRPAALWAEKAVTLNQGERVEAVDPAARTATCVSGRTFSYGELVWTAGGRARRVPGAHAIRTLADVDALKAGLETAHRVLVIGGGWIGLEAAAATAKLGKEVVLHEREPRLLARCSGKALSDFLVAEHRRQGVEVRLGAEAPNAAEFDLVVAGIGIDPEAGPLLAAGAEGGDGVLVDECGRTSLPNIWAAGDVALHWNRFVPERPIRIESVQHANDQAASVAKAIAGEPKPYAAMPWFWSNQYDLKLQTVGLSHDHDEELVRGEPGSGRFSVLYRRRGRLIAIDCVNMVRDYVQGRALIERGGVVDAARLTDPDVPLKSLVE
ncbi:FAD-dependent oxidoreductase [Sphingomonas sp. LHG3406-1]|uniref:NAD(P)/FAD-dependent oxidoreductase n=1 Tax=Sphingomonas sp. LHG3406-1 TaxID=2804617 RepID=UPI002637410A|nr:FAD-dependent oxidoreductase [Sphingomonas sp. LHG3406-1]